MKLFAVIYIKGHLAAAMFLWLGATMADCEKVNADYAATLPASQGVSSGQVALSDIRLACEFHSKNPVEDKP